MNRLHQYLQRISYGGPLSATLATLRSLQRAHLLAIPFENLDVQLEEEPSLDIDRIYEKIVTGGRGGWCYEMNALFAWALRELGFSVDLIGAAVGREKRGADAEMNHLALIVTLERAAATFANFFDRYFNLHPGRSEALWERAAKQQRETLKKKLRPFHA